MIERSFWIGIYAMNTWNHVASFDHLRNRAENLIQRARGTKTVSSASSNTPPKGSFPGQSQLQDGLSDNPVLGELVGGFGSSDKG